jgi:class 3 adenylate cyclase/tetratricopeptide (TPR) repeat protein
MDRSYALTVVTCPSCGQQNPEGARFCNACASALQAEERGLGEERKTVTVVFVDLVGFTAQAERLDPEDVRGLIGPYHSHVREELERRGGTVEKFIGDAVMAVFGAPAAHEDDPERAVRAALAIRDWSLEQKDLQVRVAVNTGEALVNVGARPAEGEAMVAGDVVNTAARMQAAAPVNGVLVGQAAYRATRDAITYRDAAAVEAKGKSEPVLVWEAVEPLARFGVDLSQRAKTPLVGRARELELVRSVLGRVRDEGATQLVTLVGVPGIGKSRLVLELFRLVDDETELITWRQGRCLPYGESVTFWALGEIVKAEAGILESDSPAEAEQKLDSAVATLVPDATEARWLRGELRALVGLSADETGSQTAGAAWRRFLEAVADRGPAVLVFEDLHWADDGLLDFLDELVDWLRDVPLLVVGTARPELLERRPAWGGGKANATTISLQTLAQEDTVRLISALLERPLQLADEQRTLLDRAGGNPLFAEQYVRMLSERGTTGELPESVQGVIAARLDALPQAEKELLQEASVHGKVFWVGGVAAATGVDPTVTEPLLRALERKDFVRRERRSAVAGDTQYSFQHVLLRDVAYGQIPRRARADKHLRAAQWMERLGRPEDHAELLAHHYQEALELRRAAGVKDDPVLVEHGRDALRTAGERALALSAYASAAEFFADALALSTPDDSARARILLERSRALLMLGGPGLELATEALERFVAAGDIEGQAEAATVAARVSLQLGDRVATDRYIALALQATADRPHSRARAQALTAQTGFLMLGGRFEDAIRVGAEARPLVEALGLEERRAQLHNYIGCARCCLGDEDGLAEIEMSIAVAENAGAAIAVVNGYGNLASELYFFGKLAESRAAENKALELAERYGAGYMRRNSRASGATWAYVDGRWNDALTEANELLALADGGDPHYSDAQLLAVRGWIEHARGDLPAAERDTRRAVELARASDLQAQSQSYCIGGSVALAAGRRDEADELASDLAALGPPMVPALCAPFPTLAEVAWLFHDLGRAEEFVEVVLDPDPIKSPWNDAARAICDGELARAADIIDAIGHTASAAYTRLRAAEALAAAGEDAGAAAQRAQGEAFYRAVGAIRFVSNGETLDTAPGDDLRASVDG